MLLVRFAPLTLTVEAGTLPLRLRANNGSDGSFDYLISAREEHWWDSEAERTRGSEIDQQLELCRLLHGSSLGLAPFSILST